MQARLNAELMRRAHRHLRAQDADFSALIRRYPPCPLHRGRADLFHTLVSSIVGQQLSVKAANTIRRRLLDLSATRQLSAVPLAQLSTAQLRAAGLSGAKTRYVQGLANAALDGALNFRSLARQSDEQVIDTLVALPGVGAWTAKMFLIFGLRRPDVAAPDDVGLQRGMQFLLELPERPDHDTFMRLAEPWRPFRSVASWYLWRLAG